MAREEQENKLHTVPEVEPVGKPIENFWTRDLVNSPDLSECQNLPLINS